MMNLQYLDFNPIALNGFTISPYEYEGAGDVRYHKNASTLQAYKEVLSRHTTDVNTVFEMGIKEGGSLVLWQLVFGCKIIGGDINVDQISPLVYDYAASSNIQIEGVDLENVEFMEHFARKMFTASGIDVAIDDGPHTITSMPNNFLILRHYMNAGGLYILEDYQALHPIHIEQLRKVLITQDTEWLENFIIVKFHHKRKRTRTSTVFI